MDGSGMKKIVTENLYMTFGITVDYPTKRVYWNDNHFDRIESVDYEGMQLSEYA